MDGLIRNIYIQNELIYIFDVIISNKNVVTLNVLMSNIHDIYIMEDLKSKPNQT